MPRDQRDISVTFDDLKQEVATILFQRDELLESCKKAIHYITHPHGFASVYVAFNAALEELERGRKLVEGEQ